MDIPFGRNDSINGLPCSRTLKGAVNIMIIFIYNCVIMILVNMRFIKDEQYRNTTILKWFLYLFLVFIITFPIKARADYEFDFTSQGTVCDADYSWHTYSEFSFLHRLNGAGKGYLNCMGYIGSASVFNANNGYAYLKISLSDSATVTGFSFYVNNVSGTQNYISYPTDGSSSLDLSVSSTGWKIVSITPNTWGSLKANFGIWEGDYPDILMASTNTGYLAVSSLVVRSNDTSNISFFPSDATVNNSLLFLNYTIIGDYPNANIKVVYTYNYTNNNGSSYILTHEGTFDGVGSFSLQDYIINRNNFSGKSVRIDAYLYGNWDSFYNPFDLLSNDSVIFDQNSNYTVPVVPSPTPIPTPTYTPFPTPSPITLPNYTPPPISENNTINNSWSSGYFSYVDGQMSNWNYTISNISAFGTFPITTFRGYVDDVNTSLNSVNYSKSVFVLGLIVPVMVDSLHWKVKALVTFYLVCVLILIVLGRE